MIVCLLSLSSVIKHEPAAGSHDAFQQPCAELGFNDRAPRFPFFNVITLHQNRDHLDLLLSADRSVPIIFFQFF